MMHLVSTQRRLSVIFCDARSARRSAPLHCKQMSNHWGQDNCRGGCDHGDWREGEDESIAA